jgi:hypothetical protein
MLYAAKEGKAPKLDIVIFPVLVRTNVRDPAPLLRSVPELLIWTVPDTVACAAVPSTRTDPNPAIERAPPA